MSADIEHGYLEKVRTLGDEDIVNPHKALEWAKFRKIELVDELKSLLKSYYKNTRETGSLVNPSNLSIATERHSSESATEDAPSTLIIADNIGCATVGEQPHNNQQETFVPEIIDDTAKKNEICVGQEATVQEIYPTPLPTTAPEPEPISLYGDSDDCIRKRLSETGSLKPQVQILATAQWNKLHKSGAYPTRHSILNDVLKLCRKFNVTMSSGNTPSLEYITKMLRRSEWNEPERK